VESGEYLEVLADLIYISTNRIIGIKLIVSRIAMLHDAGTLKWAVP
jgi:hypothetical protein